METTAEQTERTQSSILTPAAPAQVTAAIADVASYPDWVSEITSAQVLDRDLEDRAAQAQPHLDAASTLDDQVLAHRRDGDRSASSTLKSSRTLENLDGSYTLAPAGTGATQAIYQLAIALKDPVPPMVLHHAERVVIQRALTGLARRLETALAQPRPRPS
ncbi:SRPBCC family protein [Amycolatopsis sp. NPDC059090]|uniref:SRPBCC family protein n=1 Tax=Amycolatopsis sp. NPDC059090 TaxID=3346723 RepID=UPI00366E3F38